jgi:acyl-CoA-binding protein
MEDKEARTLRLFNEASEKIRNFIVPQEIQLKLYGLYKQALFGDVNEPVPNFFEFKARAKYDSWLSYKGKSKDTCMKEYVLLARKHYIK